MTQIAASCMTEGDVFFGKILLFSNVMVLCCIKNTIFVGSSFLAFTGVKEKISEFCFLPALTGCPSTKNTSDILHYCFPPT